MVDAESEDSLAKKGFIMHNSAMAGVIQVVEADTGMRTLPWLTT